MFIVLSGPQHAYKKAQGAVESAGFKIVRNEAGDPDPYNHGLPDNAETRWTGAVYTQADIDALDDTEPGHPHKVGDILPFTGHLEPLEATVPTCFLTVEGDEAKVDKAHEAVADLGWRLRAHFDREPVPPKEPLAKRLAGLGIDPAELKQLIGA